MKQVTGGRPSQHWTTWHSPQTGQWLVILSMASILRRHAGIAKARRRWGAAKELSGGGGGGGGGGDCSLMLCVWHAKISALSLLCGTSRCAGAVPWWYRDVSNHSRLHFSTCVC